MRTAGVLSTEPVDPLGRLETSYPIALLPVRIETRFAVAGARPELWLRVYPDEIVAQQHKPELTAGEIARRAGLLDGRLESEPGGDGVGPARQRRAAPRAAWVARATSPTNLAARPAGQPTFPALISERGGRGAWARGSPPAGPMDRPRLPGRGGGSARDREPDPRAARAGARPAGSGRHRGPALVDVSGDGLTVDTESAWTVDFDQAVSAGMGLAPAAVGGRRGAGLRAPARLRREVDAGARQGRRGARGPP